MSMESEEEGENVAAASPRRGGQHAIFQVLGMGKSKWLGYDVLATNSFADTVRLVLWKQPQNTTLVGTLVNFMDIQTLEDYGSGPWD